jgi:hypothetical protein
MRLLPAWGNACVSDAKVKRVKNIVSLVMTRLPGKSGDSLLKYRLRSRSYIPKHPHLEDSRYFSCKCRMLVVVTFNDCANLE